MGFHHVQRVEQRKMLEHHGNAFAPHAAHLPFSQFQQIAPFEMNVAAFDAAQECLERIVGNVAFRFRDRGLPRSGAVLHPLPRPIR